MNDPFTRMQQPIEVRESHDGVIDSRRTLALTEAPLKQLVIQP
jgi:hypothetical protein